MHKGYPYAYTNQGPTNSPDDLFGTPTVMSHELN